MLGANLMVLIAIAEHGESEGWTIALGYATSVLAHLLINARYFVTGV